MSAAPAALPTHPAAALVASYLRTMEERDLARAKSMLAPGFRMTFPGDKRFDSLEQLIESSKGRYKRALKRFDRFDVADSGDGSFTVYVWGTLYGELLSGESYADIRFIDRFTVRGEKLVDQMVWNDMAEMLGTKLGR